MARIAGVNIPENKLKFQIRDIRKKPINRITLNQKNRTGSA